MESGEKLGQVGKSREKWEKWLGLVYVVLCG